MNNLLLTALLFLQAIIVQCSAPDNNSQSPKPNIVLINIDDMGWRDVGFMGSEYYETPNIDALSTQGMVFTNAYAAAANCAPSRACLMSGQWTPRHGIYTCHFHKYLFSGKGCLPWFLRHKLYPGIFQEEDRHHRESSRFPAPDRFSLYQNRNIFVEYEPYNKCSSTWRDFYTVAP